MQNNNKRVRVRFAPSPTGPLHIGGVRTALYTFLVAKKYKGDFILRIEDTDQNRYVQGTEEYIKESLAWCGIHPDEGPGIDGNFGPYRQSERKAIYKKYADQLIASGEAYYAFDTADELSAMREKLSEQGDRAPKYDYNSRNFMKNSLNMTDEETKAKLENSKDTIIRLKVEPGNDVVIQDMVRGEVVFKSEELDDKVLIKADGMPTYHMANVIDDHLMEISHVIRGEEWLSSTAHHVLLYRAFGWKDIMPSFAHLPLILKPNGNGKLSKRDGAKFGFPVFPISWKGENEEDSFIGFREFGFDPKATINFLAFLGWNPGTDQEIFSLDELIHSFDINHIVKSGARFDIDKAKWYNQQYIIHSESIGISRTLKTLYPDFYENIDDSFLLEFIDLMKERVELFADFHKNGYYFFEDPSSYEEKMIRKKWNAEREKHCRALIQKLCEGSFKAEQLKEQLETYINKNELGFGDIMPFFRIGLTGTMKGPDLFRTLALLGEEKSKKRLEDAFMHFNNVVDNK